MEWGLFIVLAGLAVYSATRTVLIRRARRTVFRPAGGSRNPTVIQEAQPAHLGEWINWPGDQSGSRN